MLPEGPRNHSCCTISTFHMFSFPLRSAMARFLSAPPLGESRAISNGTPAAEALGGDPSTNVSSNILKYHLVYHHRNSSWQLIFQQDIAP